MGTRQNIEHTYPQQVATLERQYKMETQRRTPQQKLAAQYKYDAQYEQIAEIRRTQPDKFDRLSNTTKTGFGYYAQQKAAAIAEGIDTSALSPEA
jgi:hypothetical protein